MSRITAQRAFVSANFNRLVLATVGRKPIEQLKKRETFLRSPLRYPGGKSRAIPQIINDYIPRGLDKLCSPFVGGGSIELALAGRGTTIYAYDSFEPLVHFWRCLLNNPSLLAEKVRQYQDMTPTMFYNLQKRFSSLEERIEIAAAFYALNRSSFSGTTLSGGMSPGHPRFTEKAIKNLESFKISNFNVAVADFSESIKKHKDDFLYCDPPYLIDQKLYGQKGDQHTNFNHELLAQLLKERDGWVLSYNDCPQIREIYKDYYTITPSWAYGMGNSKKSKELLILSKDYRKLI